MSEEELAELAELRRRAYGPDADIAGDAAAQARLAQLEREARAARPGPAFGAATDVIASPAAEPSPVRIRRRARDGEALSAEYEAPPTTGPEASRADADRPAREEATAPGRRRRGIVLAAVGAAVLVAAALLWPRAAAPAPHPSWSPTSLADVGCGSGWGAQAAGTLRPPKPADVVWSAQWDSTSADAPDILATDQTEWLAALTPVSVPGGVASVVQVVGPSRARIVTFAESRRTAGGGLSSSAYATTDAMVAAARSIVPLPACSASDTYPLLVISPDRACVRLRVTIAEGPAYPATVAVGGACPRM